MLLMECNTLKLFRLSRKPAPSVNGGTWGFLSSFCVFFVTLLAFPQLSTSAKADVMAWRRLLASLPPRAREGLGPRGQDSDDVVSARHDFCISQSIKYIQSVLRSNFKWGFWKSKVFVVVGEKRVDGAKSRCA